MHRADGLVMNVLWVTGGRTPETRRPARRRVAVAGLEVNGLVGLAGLMRKAAEPRFAVDATTVLRIVGDDPGIGARHQLVGPAVLRSHVLSLLYREVRTGQLAEAAARAQLEGLAGLKIRLLGDRVSRATAWRIARQLDWEDTPVAEYLAVASLQADALVTSDPTIREVAGQFTTLASYDSLQE